MHSYLRDSHDMRRVVLTDRNPKHLNQSLEHFREAVRTAGVRATHQPLGIFREVAAGQHSDAGTICQGVRERLPTISLDTVYRTLWLLVDLGLITSLGPSRDRPRFGGNVRQHHHFFGAHCGRAEDFCSEEPNRL